MAADIADLQWVKIAAEIKTTHNKQRVVPLQISPFYKKPLLPILSTPSQSTITALLFPYSLGFKALTDLWLSRPFSRHDAFQPVPVPVPVAPLLASPLDSCARPARHFRHCHILLPSLCHALLRPCCIQAPACPCCPAAHVQRRWTQPLCTETRARVRQKGNHLSFCCCKPPRTRKARAL